MVFGGINSSQIHGQLKEFKIVNNKWWALNFTEFKYAGQVFDHKTIEPTQSLHNKEENSEQKNIFSPDI